MDGTWNQLLTALVGGGSGTVSVIGLLLLGRLVPVRTVEREREDRKAEAERAMAVVVATHNEAMTALRAANQATVAQKDGEIARFREDLEYERRAGTVERDRADRSSDLLGSTVRETAALFRSLTPAGHDGDAPRP